MASQNIEELNLANTPSQQGLQCSINRLVGQRLAQEGPHACADAFDTECEGLLAAGAFKVDDFRTRRDAVGTLTLERKMVKEFCTGLHPRNKVGIHVEIERIQLNSARTVFTLQKAGAPERMLHGNFTIGLTFITFKAERTKSRASPADGQTHCPRILNIQQRRRCFRCKGLRKLTFPGVPRKRLPNRLGWQ